MTLDDVGPAALQRHAYLSMLGAALQQKAHIEAYRSAPTWGTVIWQLNEIWPTTGWGSVEYGPLNPQFTQGQVAGGRWKPLHYWLVGTALLPSSPLPLCSFCSHNPHSSLDRP